jgi:hypothetical protein
MSTEIKALFFIFVGHDNIIISFFMMVDPKENNDDVLDCNIDRLSINSVIAIFSVFKPSKLKK